MSCHSDGGQRWFDCARDPHLKIRQAQALLPCENDQAKPDLFSRLARSTNCQRSLRTIRLSGALLDRGPSCYAQDVLELVALTEVTSYSNPRRFCANLLKLSSIHHPVKPNLLLCLRPPKLIVGGSSSLQIPIGHRKGEAPFQKHRTAQNIKYQPAKRA